MPGDTRKPRLTPKQERFARAIALDGMSQSDAYRTAYDASRMGNPSIWVKGSQIAAQDNVRLRVAELNEMAANAAGANRMWAMAHLKEATDRSMQASPVMDDKGNETGEWVFDARSATASIRLLADMCGWIPRGKPEPDGAPGNAEIVERLLAMDPEQLAALLAKPVGTVISDTDS